MAAETVIARALNLAPKHYDALRLGALIALRLNQTVLAHDRMSIAMKIGPVTAETSNTFGNILKAMGDWPDAEEAYQKALKLDPKYGTTRPNLIDLYIQSGQAQKAYDELEQVSKQRLLSEFELYAKTQTLIDLTRFDEALNTLESIHSKNHPEISAHLKTKIYFHLGKLKEMHQAAAQVSITSPLAADIFGITANAESMRGNWDGVESQISDLINTPDTHINLIQQAIRLLQRQGDDAQVEHLLEKAMSEHGRKPELLFELTRFQVKKRDFDTALLSIEEALNTNPQSFQYLTQYIEILMVFERFKDCEALLERCFAQAPNNQYLFALSATLKRLQNQDYDVLYDYERFVKTYDLEPPDGFSSIADFNMALSDTLDQLHKFKDAPLNQSLRGGTQTDVELSVLAHPIIQAYFKMLERPINEYMNEIGQRPDHPLTQRNTGRFRINGSWSIRLKPNGHHVNHVHPKGWISSCYYVEVPEIVGLGTANNEGWIKFGEPGIPGLTLDAEKFVQPQNGRLVLFPSYIWHGTVPFSGTQSRLTLPFDAVPA